MYIIQTDITVGHNLMQVFRNLQFLHFSSHVCMKFCVKNIRIGV